MLMLLLAFTLFKNKIFVFILKPFISESQYFKKEKKVEQKDIVYIQKKMFPLTVKQ